MKIDSVGSSGLLTPSQQKRQQDQDVQNVFSAMLAQFGRQGYASAEVPEQSTEEPQALIKGLQRSWDSWFTGELNGRYSQVENPEELKQSFGELIVRAHEEGGYVDPKGFLQKLSQEELAVVQKVQSLASPIRVSALTEEGALNLLLPPATQVDLNNDGITQSGIANGLRFPSSNTPAAVAKAWEEATEGMSFAEKAMAELQIMLPLMTANLEVDENGKFVRQYEPGDPEYRNPMAEVGYSYVAATKDRLDALEFMKHEIPADRYERQKSFWNKFQQSLIDNGAE
ncbi:hypothetical protein Pan241w_38340 [Gimesia alba]|uniref:Uncharacterized protein n=1 Tax=Gimesia alba TaxID=2527973 RepID=A0A517RIP1_9PLAN|nr:hypothetical protein [Gimesia alba]QDT43730.1 hypothetical protein Pan241w_38340 [Gimesia alba]